LGKSQKGNTKDKKKAGRIHRKVSSFPRAFQQKINWERETKGLGGGHLNAKNAKEGDGRAFGLRTGKSEGMLEKLSRKKKGEGFITLRVTDHLYKQRLGKQ